MLFVYIFVVITGFVGALRRNDTCIIEDSGAIGVCKWLQECEYAIRLIEKEQKHPPHCAWERGSDEEVVCCPLDDKPFASGRLRYAFKDTDNGVLRSDGVTCVYDGNLPVICCEEKGDVTTPEPSGCPRLAPPKKPINHVAWQKCQEYQRYVHLCKRDRFKPNSYHREKSCHMNAYSDRITGGTPALPKEFPHMVLLGCRNNADFDGKVKWISGGSLISDRYVLTAAHAIVHPNYGNVKYALLGALNKKEASKGVLHHVVAYEQYKLYNKLEKYHDIALVTLFPRVKFTDFVRPACLPLPGMKLSQNYVVAGWGEMAMGPKTSDVLLKTYVDQMSDSHCRNSFDPQALVRGWDSRTMLCAGGKPNEPNDTCKGDSGGPLMAYLEGSDLDCTYVVRGVVSWGPNCGQGSPGVYTNVMYQDYIDWISNKVWPRQTEA